MLLTGRKSEDRVRLNSLKDMIIYVMLVLAQCWKPYI